MAPEKAPAFQFYAEKFLLDENQAVMTLQQVGAYIRLMSYCWREVTIPDDPDKARLLVHDGRVSAKQFREMWPLIRICFVSSSEPGRLRHPTLDKEREKQAEWREKSAAGGRLAQANRKHPRKGGTKGGSRVVEPTGNTPSPSPSPICTPTPTHTVPAGAGGDAWEDWREAWEASGRTPLRLEPNHQEAGHCIRWATRYPVRSWRRRQVREFFTTKAPDVRKSPPSLGWFVSTWMDEIDLMLRQAGHKPEAA